MGKMMEEWKINLRSLQTARMLLAKNEKQKLIQED